MSDELNLHKLVRETADQFPETADPGVLADKVFGLIPVDQYATVIRTMLRSYVRRVMTEDRGTHQPVATPVQAPQRAKQGPPRSRYVEDMQAGIWRQRLTERTHGADGWLLLRDCTRADLEAAANERRTLAVANAKAAETYDVLAEALATSGKATVGDLPDTVLSRVLAA